MKYLLDFDGVLFDTDALKHEMARCSIDEADRSVDIFEQIKKHNPNFSVANLLFPDALKFLKTHGQDCYIVSSSFSVDPEKNKAGEEQLIKFQQAKIMEAGLFELVPKTQIKIVGHSKKKELKNIKQYLDAEGEAYVFVDDRKSYLDEARDLKINCIWMDRKGAVASINFERIPHESVTYERVNNFAELTILLETWSKNFESKP